jgi:seryl-tRNA(Sec) selenium transferase
MSTININRNNCEAIKRYIQHGPFIQEAEIIATLATRGTGACSCCMVKPSTLMFLLMAQSSGKRPSTGYCMFRSTQLYKFQ